MRFIVSCILSLFALVASSYNLSNNVKFALKTLQDGNVDSAFQCLKNAVRVNDMAAQFYMGRCYELGIGTHIDYNQAFIMYRRAAERGFIPAMESLEHCYRQGIGVEQNSLRANEWRNRHSNRHSDFQIPDLAELYKEAIIHNNSQQIADNNNSTKEQNQKQSDNNDNSNQIFTSNTLQETPSLHMACEQDNIPEIIPDVDIDIPVSASVSDNVFVWIIANENYQDVAKVNNALNDGEIMSIYCHKTLGIPKTNIHLVKDATLNNIKREINLIGQIANAFNGDISLIIYYAGHGFPDEKTQSAYIMPVDGFGSDLTTCYSMNDFYDIIGGIPTLKTIILMDACFSGSTRGNEMLYAARGIKIKPKSSVPKGKTIVFSSAQGDETAYPYTEQRHGLFTYFLLKKIKESNGNITLGALFEYVKDNVYKKSLVINGKSQTPTAIPAQDISEEWYNWKLN